MLLFTGQTKNSGETSGVLGGVDMTDHREYLDEQWDARKRMAQTERTASELYGFEFADQLHRKYLGKNA